MVKYRDEYYDKNIINRQLDKTRKLLNKPGKDNIKLMEVCGTHTMNIGRTGLRKRFPQKLTLLSGPGCPVCVTPDKYISKAVYLAGLENTVVATFGDMLKVPDSSGRSLAQFNSKKVISVYSPLEALKLAVEKTEKEVVFLGVGFETTSPTVARVIKEADLKDIENFSVLCSHKIIPPALKLLAASEDNKIDGFLLPGHVSVTIGENGYKNLPLRGVITGFEPADILRGINALLEELEKNDKFIKNCYSRAVTPKGNKIMRRILEQVFKLKDSTWRGLGTIENSGYGINKKFEKYDADKKFDIKNFNREKKKGCICGEILKGLKIPFECKLFGGDCSPEKPVGPCMVSSEGACSAYYRYER